MHVSSPPGGAPRGSRGRWRCAGAALLALLVACAADHPADPGAGTLVADLMASGATINLDVDGDALFAVLIDSSPGTPGIAVARIDGTSVTWQPLAPTDWSDYASSWVTGFKPALTARVSGGKAWFFGEYAVTVVPLDGTPSYQLFQPPTLPYTGHPYNTLGAFTVDEGSAYLCYGDISANFEVRLGRFKPDGAWEVLFTGAAPGENCFVGAFTADQEHVYWATTQALRSYRKSDGVVTQVVELGAARLQVAPWQLAIAGDQLIWLDQTGIHAAPKSLSTSAASATTLARFQPTDPMAFSLMASGGSVYWMTQTDLWRQPMTGDLAERLAHRALPPGAFMGLAGRGALIYFTNSVPLGTSGDYRLELRSVALQPALSP